MRKAIILLLLLPLFAKAQAPTSDSTKLLPATSTSFNSFYVKGTSASNAQFGWLWGTKWMQLVTGYQFNNYTGASTQLQLDGLAKLRGVYWQGPLWFDQDTASANPNGKVITWNQKTNYARFGYSAPGTISNPRDVFWLELGDDTTKRKTGQMFAILRNISADGPNTRVLDTMYIFSKLRATYNGSPFLTARQVKFGLSYTASSDSTNGGSLKVDTANIVTKTYAGRYAQINQSARFFALETNSLKITSPSFEWANPNFKDTVTTAINQYDIPNQILMNVKNAAGVHLTNIYSVPATTIFDKANEYNGITKQNLTGPAALVYDTYGSFPVDTLNNPSEGQIWNINGTQVNIARLTSAKGEYSTTGALYLRKRVGVSGAWGAWTLIFDDPATDDRNPAMSVNENTGVITIWFSKASGAGTRLSCGYIYSTNADWTTWSSYNIFTPISSGSIPYGQATKFNGRYIMSIYNNYIVEVVSSADGITWVSDGVIEDLRVPMTRQLGETSITNIGGGRMIALVRDQGNSKTLPPWQYQYTVATGWTYIGRTNLNNGNFGQSPFIYADTTRNTVITIGSQRTNVAPTQDKIFFYANTPNEIWNDTTAYILKKEVPRPTPNGNNDFYGYPCLTKNTDGSYTGFFSDAFTRLTESANQYISQLYEFSIYYKTTYNGIAIPSRYNDVTYSFNALNNKIETNVLSKVKNNPYGGLIFQGTNLTIDTVRTNRVYSQQLSLAKVGSGTTSGANIEMIGYQNNSTAGAYLRMGKSRNSSSGLFSPTTSGTSIAVIDMMGVNNVNVLTNAVRLTSTQIENSGSFIKGRLDIHLGTSTSATSALYTFTADGMSIGGNTNPQSKLIITGNSSTSALSTTVGKGLTLTAMTSTDTASAASTVYTTYAFNRIGRPTQAFTNPVTITKGYNFYIDNTLNAGSNATIGSSYALGVNGAVEFNSYTTQGGLFYSSNTSGQFAQTGAGTSTTVLHGGTTPSYSAVNLASDVTGTLPIANGGTGSTTKNFVDLTTTQTVAGAKSFTNTSTFSNYYSTSAAPTINAGPEAGTGATVSIVGTNQDGELTVNTGTGAITGVLCTVTLSGGFEYPTKCTPVITNSNGLANTNGVSVQSLTANSFVIYLNGSMLSSTTYKFTYHIGGY